MNAAMIRPWLFVGNRNECDENANKYDGIIHIWRNDYPDHSCKYIHDGEILSAIFNYTLEYKDGASLPEDELNRMLDIKLSKKYGKLLIHCAAGQTRSPTIALFILSLVERLHPFAGLEDIYSNIWRQRNKIANICLTPLEDIVKWYEKHLYNAMIFGEVTAAIKGGRQ